MSVDNRFDTHFWIELREPRKVPERKGPYPHGTLTQTIREFMTVRPTAYITVVTVSPDGPDFQDGPEALMMADMRSQSPACRHIRRTREAHHGIRGDV